MLRTLTTLVLLGGMATTAHAQFSSRPGGVGSSGGYGSGGAGSSSLMGGIGTAPSSAGFSPYLNLFSGRASPAVNLYGIVRPQQSLQQGLQNLQQSYIAGGLGGQEESSGGIAVIGTKVRFLDTGGYFLNIAGGTTSAGGSGGGLSRPRSGAGGGLSSFGALPSSAGSGGLSVPQQGSLGGSGTGSFGSPSPKGGGRPANSSKN